ncbi:unnamed protein product [Diplocarpon coronariae]|uniref:Uncharacterized protein n=1 Tax=Diplocarpon coronariae TaxID=2795749 RepID=A0A218YV69_9HELO|nr:hypothetical protein B2J93_8783 [Marssonina coronariae]
MPSLDIEMSNSTSSPEAPDIDMDDIGPESDTSPENEKVDDGHVTETGHLTQPGVFTNGKHAAETGDTGGGHTASTGEEILAASVATLKTLPKRQVEHESSESSTIANGLEVKSPAAQPRLTNGTSLSGKNGSEADAPVKAARISAESIKLDKEILRLQSALFDISPKAAQKVLKDRWRLFLFETYNEDHITFILRAGLKNSSPEILDRVLKDEGVFRDVMVKSVAKTPGFLETALRGAAAANALDSLPEDIIDLLIAHRIKKVSGRTLIKWLAEGKRLGFKADDILNEDDESVIPNVPIPDPNRPGGYHGRLLEQSPAPGARPSSGSAFKDSLLAEQERQASLNKDHAKHVQAAIARNAASAEQHIPGPVSRNAQSGPASTSIQAAAVARQREHARAQVRPTGPLLCSKCHVTFDDFSGYTYHVTKNVCDKIPPPGGYKWSCQNCQSGFTTKQGMDYHNMRDVCFGSNNIAPPTSAIQFASGGTISLTTGTGPQNGPSTLPPTRPPMYSQQASLHGNSLAQYKANVEVTSQVSRPIAQTPQQPVAISRPLPAGTSTPRRLQGLKQIRHSPSELPPEKRAQMERELQEAVDKCEQNIAALPADMSESERASRSQSYRNARATRQSQIRKSYGVSLRLRQTEKAARVLAGLSAVPGSKLKEPCPMGPSAGSPPAPSFSAINSPNRPTNSFGSGPPPPKPNFQPFVPLSNSPGMQDGAPLHSINSNYSASGFGVLRPNIQQHTTPTTYQARYARSSLSNESTHSPPDRSTPGLSMMEVSSEDAAARFAKTEKPATGEEDKHKDADTEMREAPAATPAATSAAPASSEVIEILSDSSDSEGAEVPIKSIESNEDAIESNRQGPEQAQHG